MLQAAGVKPGTWPRIRADDVRGLLGDLDRVTEEMIEAIQCGVPTAVQKLPEVQLTPPRVSAWAPDGAAMGTNRQLVPFQISVP